MQIQGELGGPGAPACGRVSPGVGCLAPGLDAESTGGRVGGWGGRVMPREGLGVGLRPWGAQPPCGHSLPPEPGVTQTPPRATLIMILRLHGVSGAATCPASPPSRPGRPS